jgi:hypothetical protein
MRTDLLVDTFELQIKLTHAIMLAIVNFCADHSYRVVSRTHRITNVATGVTDGTSYLTLSFERC